MYRVLKVLRWLIFVVLLLVILAGSGGYLYLRQSLPEMTGAIKVAGLSDSVEVIRDQDGIPHIYAQNKPDVFFGLGYVHAQDRLWQMEFQRRVGQGRLSEVIGEPTIGTDRFLRTLGVYRAAQRAWDAYPPQARALIEAYIAGINAFIADHQGSQLPIEFTVFRLQPEPWTGPDVLVWAKMMAFDLGGNFGTELMLTDLIKTIGTERANQLLPSYPENGVSILREAQDLAMIEQDVDRLLSAQTLESAYHSPAHIGEYQQLLTLTAKAQSLLDVTGGVSDAVGSNNWVVDGTKSTTGYPLLANDPHLGTRVPSTWYLAHLSAQDLDVIGATLPGLPGVVIGRNQHIAWGVTNLRPDVQDLFRERVAPNGQQVEFQGQMEPIQLITETITVKGQPSVQHVVRLTRHGPIISDAMNANFAQEPPERRPPPREPLAIQWTALDTEDQTVRAFLEINEAQNWDQFRGALEHFVAPAQNFVYGDTGGNIGYYAAGHVPVRAAGQGMLPAEGWSGAHEWVGRVPFEEMPHTYNPPEHFIVTANNQPISGTYPYLLGHEWDSPYRAQRITELLEAKDKLSPDDFNAIQADTVSIQARELLPKLLTLVNPQNDEQRRAVEILRNWNADARRDSSAPLIFAAWLRRLPQAVVGDELGQQLTEQYRGSIDGFAGRFVINTFEQRTDPWCDNITTSGTEDCAAIATQTFATAINELKESLGTNLDTWKWEQLHMTVFPHQPFGDVDVIRTIFNRKIANGGDWSTVNSGPFGLDSSFEQFAGPVYRQIVDLSTIEGGQFIQAIGQSGNIMSPHYDDYLADWQMVRYRPMRFSRAAIEQAQQSRLMLEP